MKRLSARDYAASLAQAFGEVEASQRPTVVGNFLQLLRRQRASNLLPRIMDHLQQLDDQARGLTRVHVTTALVADGKALMAKLEKVLGRVAVETTVDPSLVGGLSIRVGDQLVDGSVRAELQHLHTQLMSAHV